MILNPLQKNRATVDQMLTTGYIYILWKHLFFTHFLYFNDLFHILQFPRVVVVNKTKWLNNNHRSCHNHNSHCPHQFPRIKSSKSVLEHFGDSKLLAFKFFLFPLRSIVVIWFLVFFFSEFWNASTSVVFSISGANSNSSFSDFILDSIVSMMINGLINP